MWSVLIYGSEMWVMKASGIQRLERTERLIVRWMCGVTLKDKRLIQQLLNRLGVDDIIEVARYGRLCFSARSKKCKSKMIEH